MKILFVSFIHGNEPLGEIVYKKFTVQYPELRSCIDYVVANPRARQQNVRFVESDMNRSFDTDLQTYEANQARTLKAKIMKQEYDLVIDFHNTDSITPVMVIGCDVVNKFRPLLRSLGISNIAELKLLKMNSSSLDGAISNALCIELSIHDDIDARVEEIVAGISNYINGVMIEPNARNIYYVNKPIYKKDFDHNELQNKDLRNFKKSPTGYYPVLYGESAYSKYTDYLGFSADKYEVVEI